LAEDGPRHVAGMQRALQREHDERSLYGLHGCLVQDFELP
jgi:hypothetical protein